MNFVIDTSVIISAIYRSSSIPNEVFLFAFNGMNRVYYTEYILFEYEDVLNRPKFHFNKEQVTNFIYQIREKGILAKKVIYQYKGKMIDDDDRVFYELAKSYNCYLITGNKRHYPNDPMVLTPSEFMNKLRLLS